MKKTEKHPTVNNEGNEVLADVSVSFQDCQVFFDTVFSNTKPNENLVAAAKRYKSKHQREMTSQQVAEIIQKYAKQNIHIEVICDGFKLNMPVCYRGVIHYLNENGEWITDDIGCHSNDWQAAFDEVVECAEHLNTKER